MIPIPSFHPKMHTTHIFSQILQKADTKTEQYIEENYLLGTYLPVKENKERLEEQ